MSDSRRFKRAFVFGVYSLEGRKAAGPPFGWELAIAGRSGSFLFFNDVHRIFRAPDALALDTTSPASQMLTKQNKKCFFCVPLLREHVRNFAAGLQQESAASLNKTASDSHDCHGCV